MNHSRSRFKSVQYRNILKVSTLITPRFSNLFITFLLEISSFVGSLILVVKTSTVHV